MAEQLGDQDFKVVSVPDGEAALSLCADSVRPAAYRSGDAKARWSRAGQRRAQLPAHRFLPVLVLSCRHPSEFDAHRRQGVTGWMVKPIDAEHLRRWVRRVLPD